MLINLSSENEVDPAKFTNNFNEIIEIKPNSYICLVKGSVIRLKNQKSVSIPPDTDIFIRYTCYDIARLRLNPGGADNVVLTIDELIADINSRFAEVGFAYTKSFRAVPRISADGDNALDLIFYHQQLPVDLNFTLEAEVYGSDNARITKFGEVLANGAALPFPANNGGAGASISFINSEATAWALSPIWNTDYRTTNTNQANGNSFGLLVDPHARIHLNNNGYSPFQWFINQPNTEFKIQLGSTTSNDNVPSQIVTGPISGTNQGDNPTGKQKIGGITFEQQQGQFRVEILDRSTDNFELIGPIDYNPGDLFEYFLRENDALPVDFEHCFYQNLVHYRTNGLVFAYNGNLATNAQRPGNNNYFLSNNVTQPQSNATELSNMSYPYSNKHLTDKYLKQNPGFLNEFANQWIEDFKVDQTNYISGNACIGIRGMNGFDSRLFGNNNYEATGSGWVYNQSLGRPATKQFTSAFAEDGGIFTQYRFATGVQGFNNRDGTQRANGSQIEIPNAYRLNTTGGIIPKCPTLIAWSATFDDAAETMIPAALDPNLRTLVGNDTGRMFEIQLNQGNTALPGGWDFRITDSAGGTVTNILVDAGGNRINFRSSTNAAGFTYNFILRYYGPNHNFFRLTVEETQITGTGRTMTTTQFQNQGPIQGLAPNQHLATINCFGGRNPLTDANNMTNYNDYSPLTYFCNIRIYQLSTRAGQDASTLDLQAEALTRYFNQHPTYDDATDTFWIKNTDTLRPDRIDFYPNSTNEFIAPTNAMGTNENYNVTGISNSRENVGIIIQKTDAEAPVDPNAPIINSIYIPGNQILNNGRRFTDLPAEDYEGSGEGAVSLQDIEPILDFFNPVPDANNNIIQNPDFVNSNGQANPTSRIQTEADQVIVDPQAMNIEVTNLTHSCLNGTNKSNDKTIYQLPMISDTEEIGNNEIVEFTPPSKVWLPLNNPGPIYLNKMDIQISNTDGTKVSNDILSHDTLVTVQIENDKNLLN